MNELLQKHGCSTVFSVPDGLKELMSDISREVIREQPSKILEFITNYLSALIITREHGVMAVRVLDDLCDCRPSLSQHLMQLGLSDDKAKDLANIISDEIEGFAPVGEKDKIKESKILGRILKKMPLDEETAAQVCEIARNAYRDYWYRMNKEKEKLKPKPKLPSEIAAQHTLAIYKTTRPTLEEMNIAAEKIQAAYKGYYIRKNLQHLNPKEMSLEIYTLPPVMTSGSRTIDFGPIVNIKVQEDNIEALFGEEEHFYEPGKINNTPAANTMISRHSETQELHRSGSPKYADGDITAAVSEWKDIFYLEATKKANKDREELKMSAPPGVLIDVTVGLDNFKDDDTCDFNSISKNALKNEQGDADTQGNIQMEDNN